MKAVVKPVSLEKAQWLALMNMDWTCLVLGFWLCLKRDSLFQFQRCLASLERWSYIFFRIQKRAQVTLFHSKEMQTTTRLKKRSFGDRLTNWTFLNSDCVWKGTRQYIQVGFVPKATQLGMESEPWGFWDTHLREVHVPRTPQETIKRTFFRKECRQRGCSQPFV
jgi:hypothetical protein